jgi:hypothetical protein
MNVFSPNPSPENATGNHAKQCVLSPLPFRFRGTDHHPQIHKRPLFSSFREPPTNHQHARKIFSQTATVSLLSWLTHPNLTNLFRGTGQFQCGFDGCTRSYKRQFELNRHQQIHSSIRSHGCRFMACNRSGRNGFTRKDHLRQHLRQVHGVSS